MQSTTVALCALPAPVRIRSLAFQQGRSSNVNRSRNRLCARAQRQIDASDLAVLTQRVQQLKTSHESSQWPGYKQWRESTDSPWSGFGKWRTTNAAEEQRRSSVLRQRMSKPTLPDPSNVVEEDGHFRFAQLDSWHQTAWENFRQSELFDD